jgi:mitochondrial fission protein ELM1
MRLLPPDVLALPRPITAVLLGGSNDVYELTPAVMTMLAGRIASAVRRTAGSVVVTPSRRTDPECVTILRRELQALPHFVWDGAGANPYFGLLGLADFLIVTCDSVNMVSEACATGKPVYVAELPGGSEKFRRFHRLMREDGLTRVFAGELVPYAYAPLDDMGEVVARVGALLGRGA